MLESLDVSSNSNYRAICSTAEQVDPPIKVGIALAWRHMSEKPVTAAALKAENALQEALRRGQGQWNDEIATIIDRETGLYDVEKELSEAWQLYMSDTLPDDRLLQVVMKRVSKSLRIIRGEPPTP